MADAARFGMLRKLLRALGLSDAAVNDLIDWITDRLADERQATGGKESAPIFPYRVRDDFLSPAERNFYQVLKSVAGTRLLICPKVSLSDLFYVKSSEPREFRVYTNKIDHKHVDFVLCDPQTLTPLAGVELDDKSHERADRRERDGFVDGVFAAARLALLRVRVQRGYQPQELAALLGSVLPAMSDQPASAPAQFPATGQVTASPTPHANGHSGNGEKNVVVAPPMCP